MLQRVSRGPAHARCLMWRSVAYRSMVLVIGFFSFSCSTQCPDLSLCVNVHSRLAWSRFWVNSCHREYIPRRHPRPAPPRLLPRLGRTRLWLRLRRGPDSGSDPTGSGPARPKVGPAPVPDRIGQAPDRPDPGCVLAALVQVLRGPKLPLPPPLACPGVESPHNDAPAGLLALEVALSPGTLRFCKSLFISLDL